MLNKKLKIVFMGVPLPGGNYTHFQYLSRGLEEFDWILLQIGKLDFNYSSEQKFVNICKNLDRNLHQKELAYELKNYLEDNNVDILIPMNSAIAISIIPYLSQSVKVVNIVNSNTKRAYKGVTEHREYISSIITMSILQKNKLKKWTHANLVYLIPHGQVVTKINRSRHRFLKIGFLGRLHDGHKGILLIPEILKDLDFKVNFEIVGDGPDKEIFLKKLKEYNISYSFFGFKEGTEKESIISQWDIMLFPSYIEGFGLTLIECMKYGVIPIANKIEGVTNFIISDGKDGFIIPKNKIKKYQGKLKLLNQDKNLMESISKNAISKIENEFSLENTISLYRKVFSESIKFDKPKQLEWSGWKTYKEYNPPLYQKILNRLKNIRLKKR